MKRLFTLILLSLFLSSLAAQAILTLDSCRALAISTNKDLMIGTEKIQAAHYQRKAAFTNYLPHLSGTGAYLHSGKDISLLSDQQKEALNRLGTHRQGSIQDFAQSVVAQYPDLAPLMSSLGGTLPAALDGIGSSLVDALTTHTRNIYVGAITLTQPIYMGGKIRAYNKISRYTEELAREQHETEMQEVILGTDQAYWQVVSLVHKKKLAEGYLALLNKMDSDMEKLIGEGVATRADGLSVKVKVNEAEMTLTKVDNGLTLARMLLCQICGLDLHTPLYLADEAMDNLPVLPRTANADVETAFANRSELRSLELAGNIYRQKVNVTRSEHLPTVALTGSYLTTSPSAFNGLENKFRGTWSAGVMVQIPIWNWGEGTYKVRAARAEANIARYQLEDAREKIELQVSQSAHQVQEATQKLIMAEKNMEKANENLRYATLGFEEGVIPASNVLEAHTAWLSAQSEKIDAQIDVKLTEIYLNKAMGTLR